MEMESRVVLILVNLGICTGIFWISLCRISHMDSQTKGPIRWRYVMWFLVALASGFSWILNYPATPGQIFVGFCVLVDLSLGFRPWQNGAPTWSRKIQGSNS